MRHGSVFSGIGGFDLAAEWMNWENIFYCEFDPFCRRVLKYYWPNAEAYIDIREFEATKFRGSVDVLTGGFPCQPFSVAGRRAGTSDNRYLWPEMLRVIKEVQPNWVVAENVVGILNWNRGVVFEQIQADLENAGYSVQPVLLPACGVEAPHIRNRIWFIAHTNGSRQLGHSKSQERPTDGQNVVSNVVGPRWTSTHTYGPGFQRPSGASVSGEVRRPEWSIKIPIWDKWPVEAPVYSRNDGVSTKLDGITFPSWRTQSIHAFGNAIVPQVALQIFRTIEAMEISKAKE